MLITPAADGGCAIDLSLQPFATAARNTPREINIATDQLIEKCVMRSPDKAGGRTKGFGMLRDAQRPRIILR